jgi:glyoxylase-like metal-dependent hydrolase (beta-lactamase superfamily II)
MLQYFDTTRKLIDLQPVLAIPAHGPPHYDPCALLRSYIAHRQAREDQILAAITQVRQTRPTTRPMTRHDQRHDTTRPTTRTAD